MPEQTFDVFLAHNSKDKPLIRQICEELKNRGVKLWLDEERIVPGDRFLDKIQEAISQSKTAIVCIGSEGLGRWQEIETEMLISLCIQQGVKVIPVLLPPIEALPSKPLFLQLFQFVRLEKDSENKRAFDLLELGITGPKSVSNDLKSPNTEVAAPSPKLILECNPEKILFIKNVKDPSGRWAYPLNGVLPSKTPTFELMWRPSGRGIDRPKAGDLMLLHQQAKVTHLIEFLDENVRKTDVGSFRLVKVIWMPKHKDWHLLPHQKEILGFDPKYRDGNTHSFRSPNFIRFNQAWKELRDFQYNLVEHLAELSSAGQVGY
ncbi:toll/interleukin-1 receptor domain-containing protein [Nodosilinea nodulosa]|uniref:toll/interleukin-1 receptor domain-containing protein n=1 Tax=Nodosilinea nodulosa TaxID=416001 RepID=UPI0002F0F343|nr:toll/interleukin-1 receptor domain-containing protein [Nodosilinea nodulosa]